MDLLRQELREEVDEGLWDKIKQEWDIIRTPPQPKTKTGTPPSPQSSAQSKKAAKGEVPPPIEKPSKIYQKVLTAAEQFSHKFNDDFQKIAATLNDPNLTKYVKKFKAIKLDEQVPHKNPDPNPKIQFPSEFLDLKKSISDFVIGLAPLVGDRAITAKDSLEKVFISNVITPEEKRRLKKFIANHLQVIKYLRVDRKSVV